MSKLKPKRKAKRSYKPKSTTETNEPKCFICLGYHNGKACPKHRTNGKREVILH